MNTGADAGGNAAANNSYTATLGGAGCAVGSLGAGLGCVPGAGAGAAMGLVIDGAIIILGVAGLIYLSESAGGGDGSVPGEGGNNAPVPDATPGRETKGRTTQWEKDGGMDEANEDFDRLGPDNVRELQNGGRVGTLPDGKIIVVRPDSPDGRPTLEIQSGKKKDKVRCGK